MDPADIEEAKTILGALIDACGRDDLDASGVMLAALAGASAAMDEILAE